VVPLVSWLVTPQLDVDSVPSFRVAREVPVLLLYMVMSELWFYSIHRVCHKFPFLYAVVHEHHHRIEDPHVIHASYQHPLEMVFITMGTCWIGPLLLPGHEITIGLQVVLVAVFGNFGHCGIPNIHDSHHRIPAGNYGFLWLADWLFGTMY
jgi:sterol desaturase/sphingolipid hydroxylase (fatty acid hydroxylase superfamily)